jgi:alkylation response protein AidB-like acyl-CoA dehydrogenase
MVELKTTPGVRTADIEHKLGVFAGSTGEVFFDNAEVPVENRIGEEGQGFKVAMYSLDQGRFTVAAGAVGVIRACLEASVKYANERETFGQKIGRYQFVQGMIADMVVMYEQARLLVWNAAHAKNRAVETGARTTRETSMAKMVATEYAWKAADLAVQVHGAYGYSDEYPVARYLRNARAPRLYEGTTEIHKMMLAEDALGYRSLDGRR